MQARARRPAAVAAALFAVLVPLAPGAAPPADASHAGPPNVLLVITDDQRFGTMGVMPQTRAWLGAGGRRYPSAYVTTPRCCPARASIMTGRYAHNHGVVNNREVDNLDHSTTIQRYLQTAGYRTGFFGKFLNNWDVNQPPPYFDDWAMTPQSGVYYDALYNIRGTVRSVPTYATSFLYRRFQRFLNDSEAEDDTPWLSYINWIAPHGPAVPAPKYAQARVGDLRPPPSMFEHDPQVDPTRLTDKPPYVKKNSDYSLTKVARARRAHLRTLKSVDDRMGEIRFLLNSLAETNTLVIYISDNGLMWREHLLTSKAAPYTPAVRVPMFLAWPDHVEPGTDARIVSNLDIAATILAATGVDPDPSVPVDGKDLLDPEWSRDRLLLESWPQRTRDAPIWASLVRAHDQYTEYYTSDGTTIDFREYYDNTEDPWQLVNVMGDAASGNDLDEIEIADLSSRLALDRTCSGRACP